MRNVIDKKIFKISTKSKAKFRNKIVCIHFYFASFQVFFLNNQKNTLSAGEDIRNVKKNKAKFQKNCMHKFLFSFHFFQSIKKNTLSAGDDLRNATDKNISLKNTYFKVQNFV